MIRRIMYILLFFILLALIILGILMLKQKNKNYNVIDNELIKESYSFTEDEINKYNDFFDKGIWKQIILFVKKNGNWDDIPLTKHFREKYNEKDGILGEIQFDKVEYFPYEEGTYPFTRTSYFVITQGKKKTAYNYNVKYIRGKEVNVGSLIGLIDDITLSDPIAFIDENGNELDTRIRCTEENWKEILMMLAHGNKEKYNSIAFTDKFNSQYDSLNDLISKKINESGACYGYKSNDFKNKVAECYWYTKSGDKIVKVRFVLDDREYIDDIEVLSSELLKK